MAKSKALIAAETRIAELEAKVAALEARISVAKTVFRNQRDHIGALESQLNARGAVKVMPAEQQPPKAAPVAVVTRYTKRDGTVIEKVRIGNRATERVISGAIETGAHA